MENEILFSIIHPSRNRSDWATRTAFDIVLKSNLKVEYIFSLDNDERELRNYEIKIQKIKKENCKFIIHKSDSKNCVQSLNAGAKIATGNILIYISDDFLLPRNWDILLYNEIKKHPEMNDDFVIWVSDGIQDKIMTTCILSRKYYERFGYIYFPEYQSMYADNEFTEVAKLLNRIIYAKHIIFKHEHFSVLRKSPDLTYRIQNDPIRYETGKKLFEIRKQNNFGLKL